MPVAGNVCLGASSVRSLPPSLNRHKRDRTAASLRSRGLRSYLPKINRPVARLVEGIERPGIPTATSALSRGKNSRIGNGGCGPTEKRENVALLYLN